MAESDAQTPRERYRAQVRDEIKKHAWEQIATAGASALSLNAIAKRIGVSGPALYRYYANRDELITELVRDAYRSLADTFRARADAGADLAGLAHALRGWALDDPQRYLLVYGTPVPGYRAPEDTTRIAGEIMTVLLDACTAAGASAETVKAGAAAKAATPAAGKAATPAAGKAATIAATAAVGAVTVLEGNLDGHRAWAGDHPAAPSVLRQALTVWTRLHGVLSLELAGHFAGMEFDPARLYTAEVESLTRRWS